MSQTYTVAVYLVDRAFGGHEEGGWWYDTGQLAKICRVFKREETAYVYSRRLNDKLKSRTYGPNVSRREPGSVLSDGEYWAQVRKGDDIPKYYPDRRPHYE
jgi:hypothetical protein